MNIVIFILILITTLLYYLSLKTSYQTVKIHPSIKHIVIICNILFIIIILMSIYKTYLNHKYIFTCLGNISICSLAMIFFEDTYDTYKTLENNYYAARSLAKEYILGIKQSPYQASYESECNKDGKRIIELEAQLGEATRRANEAEQRAVKAEEQLASCRVGHGLCSTVFQMRIDGKTDEEIAKYLKKSGLSIPQIGALLHTSPYISNSARVKHAQRLLGVS